jgi:hypothetical protein
MAKSYNFLRILFTVTVFLCGSACCADVTKKPGSVTYARQALSAKRLLIRSIYTAEIGVREKGSNAGERVEEYQRYSFVKKGDAWCAAFVCWVLGKAGVENPRNGWSPILFPANKVIWRSGILANKMIPQAGDVFGIWFNNLGRIAHVGFIDQWNETWFISVEGNSVGDSKTGQGVNRKRRLTSTIRMVAAYTE